MAVTAKRPFWMHQLVEYILGGALIACGLQSPTPLVPAVLGGLIMLNAAITKGPLGAFRVISRTCPSGDRCRGHRRSTSWPRCNRGSRLDSGRRIIVVGIGSCTLFVWWQTNFAERVQGRRPVLGAKVGAAPRSAAFAGRLVGNGVNAVRRPRRRMIGSLTAMSFDPPPPDLHKLQAAWEEWERGEQPPGKVLANLKTAGLAIVLAQLVESGWSPAA